jgi:ABC-2 type transport system permease protein
MPNNKFAWMLKREFWEYRGAFLWTPVITGTVMLALFVFGLVVAEHTAHRAGVHLSGLNINEIARHLNEGDAAKLHAGLSLAMLSLGVPIGISLFFVLFVYGIGALYNDRADRSVLFWKSLPISDTETVLAKVVAMALVAPVLAVGAMIALHLAFLAILSLWVLAHGINPMLLWSPGHLVALWVKLLVLIPINALWALPSIGWLLLCSSFARSKPFLWAVALPVVTGVLLWMVDLMNSLSLPNGWFWRNVVGRLLFSIVPGTWVDAADLRSFDSDDRLPEALNSLLSFDSIGHLVSSPNFLIGVAAGAAMIVAAIYFRRKRTESYA